MNPRKYVIHDEDYWEDDELLEMWNLKDIPNKIGFRKA